MRLKTTTEVSVEERPYCEYFELTLEDGGVRIRVKSPLIARYIKELSKGMLYDKLKASHPWSCGEQRYFMLPNESIPYVKGWIYTGDPSWFVDGAPNILWICHEKLAEGVDILVKQPIAKEDFEDYYHKCCEVIQDTYMRHLRKVTARATFSELWEEA